MLPVSLDCSFLIALSISYNVCLYDSLALSIRTEQLLHLSPLMWLGY